VYAYLLTVLAVAAQFVTVEMLSPQPTCANQALVYNCQIHLPSVGIWWKHSAFGSLYYRAGDEEEGSIKNTSDGRFVANLTMNDGTVAHCMVASTLRIQPPLNDLNNTILTCEGFNLVKGVISDDATILLVGRWG